MGVQLDAWSALLTQVTGDTALDTFIGSRFYVGHVPKILRPNQFPFVFIDCITIPQENFIAVPKLKVIRLRCQIHGKVFNNTDVPQLILDSLELDELIKNAIEKDLTLGGDASLELIDSSAFRNLDGNVRESIITFDILTKKFVGGSR